MAIQHRVTLHQHSTPKGDPNRRIDVDRLDSPRPTSSYYRVQFPAEPGVADRTVFLTFTDGPPTALTNEVLLAVMLDRLDQWDATGQGCVENRDARKALESALVSFHSRAARVAREKEASVESEAKKCAESGRVRVTETEVFVGAEAPLLRSDLAANWITWNRVERRLLAFNPPPTAGEMEALALVPEKSGGRNGLEEVTQALKRISRA